MQESPCLSMHHATTPTIIHHIYPCFINQFMHTAGTQVSMINRIIKGMWPTMKEVIMTEVMKNAKLQIQEQVFRKVGRGLGCHHRGVLGFGVQGLCAQGVGCAGVMRNAKYRLRGRC